MISGRMGLLSVNFVELAILEHLLCLNFAIVLTKASAGAFVALAQDCGGGYGGSSAIALAYPIDIVVTIGLKGLAADGETTEPLPFEVVLTHGTMPPFLGWLAA